ncbi:MAG: hypothetical protein JWN44_5638 [Myxococcales bacterium]|nr:hypothetical protein [Myxococcales bacterium]
MSLRVVFAMLALWGASGAASAHKPGASSAQKHRRAKAALVLHEPAVPSSNDGATIDAGTGTVLVVSPAAKVRTTFVELHSARVEKDLMLFQPTGIGLTPSRRHEAELFEAAPVKKQFRFVAAAATAESLDVRRDRDRLVLFRGPQPQGAAVALGLAMFGTMTVLSAHMPRPVRVVFDGPVHLGPAIFDGGGMGAGIAGRL